MCQESEMMTHWSVWFQLSYNWMNCPTTGGPHWGGRSHPKLLGRSFFILPATVGGLHQVCLQPGEPFGRRFETKMCLKARYRIPTHVYFMSADVLFYPGQDRIPMSSSSTTAPPPYPMKLAPADHQTGKLNGCHALFFFQIKTADHQTEDPDSQLIRAETCVFLVKLPRYCRCWLFGKGMMFFAA